MKPFNPALVTITRHRFSVTQGEVTVEYDGEKIERYGDQIEMDAAGNWTGKDDNYWINVARRECIARGIAEIPVHAENSRFQAATLGLTDNYLAPVPSQFTKMPRAMARTGEVEGGFSVLGYTRALADDCLAWTGCIDAPRTI